MDKRIRVTGLLSFYITVISLTLCGIILGNQTVLAFAGTKSLERKHIIIVDPGHGGMDGGAISCTGKPESGYNLEIATGINDLLHLLGYNTIMTRTEDISIYKSGSTIAQKKISDLKERLRIVNEVAEQAILISIHQNFFTQPQYSGAQVFYGAGQGSEDLAQTMQTALIKNLNKNSKRTEKKGQGIYILEKANCPAVLIECGFLSNPEEEMLLGQADYQKKLSELICISALDFLAKS